MRVEVQRKHVEILTRNRGSPMLACSAWLLVTLLQQPRNSQAGQPAALHSKHEELRGAQVSELELLELRLELRLQLRHLLKLRLAQAKGLQQQ